ncbi:MAG TPA: hypothetical protein VK466_14695 [Terriglobales bacterium]|nr:hypothetical protein [Terriglobales bacterium]
MQQTGSSSSFRHFLSLKSRPTLVLFLGLLLAVVFPVPAHSRDRNANNASNRAYRKQAKKAQKDMRRYAKQQQKATKKSVKAQKKALKRARHNSVHY